MYFELCVCTVYSSTLCNNFYYYYYYYLLLLVPGYRYHVYYVRFCRLYNCKSVNYCK